MRGEIFRWGGGGVAMFRARLLALMGLLGALLPAGAFALEPGIATPAAMRTDRVILRLAADAPSSAIGQLHRAAGGSTLRRFKHGKSTEIVKLAPGQTVAGAMAAYGRSPFVASVEPDYLLQAFAVPNDFNYANQDQWNLHNTGIYGGTLHADIAAEAGWELQREAPEIVVAVIDSGVRSSHEDLAANLWVNPGEDGLDSLGRSKRTNGIDDDGDGYVDDVHGINVLNGSGNPADDWGHGTHVAGIIGAVANNSVGIAGVAWRVKIMACKFIDAAANYSVSDAITCLDYARQHGARIVNASWGGYSFNSPALRAAIGTLRDAGIIVTAAAGNDNSDNDVMPLYPASYDFDNIIAVAGTDRTDAKAGYSNYGPTTVDLGAPSSPVFSTWAGSDRDYRYNEGTSMAAPHLAGACALIWTRFPGESHQQIIQRILSTVDPLPALAGRTKSGGRLNLAAALASGAPPPPPATLAAPSGLSATPVSETAIGLAWTDNTTTETGFEVQRSTDNVSFVPAGTTGANTTTFTASGLAAATIYYFRVRAVQDANASAYSATANATTASAPPPPAGTWLDADVGAVAAAGSSSGSGTSASVVGSGADIWNSADEFHFRYQAWNGDGAFVARLTGLTNTDAWAKAGLMIRENLTAGSRHIFIAINPGATPALFWRGTAAGSTSFRSLGYSIAQVWLKLVRSGNSFQPYFSSDGVNWLLFGAAITVDLPAGVLAGLAVTSHRDGTLATGSFAQIAFTGGSAPPPPVTVNTPTGLSATTMSSSQINLAWTDQATNETGFEVERSTDKVSFTRIATPAAGSAGYADTGLTAGTLYYYRVRAVASGATSDWSNVASATTTAGTSPPPVTWSHADIGAVGVAGSDEAAGNTITVRGSGGDIWDRADAFRFLYRSVTGDGVVEAQVTAMTNTDPWAKAGVMIRESLTTGSRNAFVFLTPSAGLHAQLRSTTNGTTASVDGPWILSVPYWVRLTRTGGAIAVSISPNGTAWTTIANWNVAMSSTVYFGFAVTAHNNGALCTATFADPFVQ